VTTGNARYAAARRRALTRQADPPQARRAPAPARRGDVADPGRPCSCTGGDRPPHSGYVHHLTETGNRTWCTITTGAGRCPCPDGYDPT
jgi:hypothetical protein